MSTYPAADIDRNLWVVANRGNRNRVSATQPYGYFTEEERTATGEIVSVATILLTNSECSWKCVMCDLWKNTLTGPTVPGTLTAQLDFALSRLPHARHIKLYNSGSFFDKRAVPPDELSSIARRVRAFERVVVECHPKLIGHEVLRFRDLCQGQLEVAMGLETAHPGVLEELNKRMTLDDFSHATKFLKQNRVDLRAFVLVQPPFLPSREALYWAHRSIDFAFDCGASVVSLLPTRGGNGAMEALARTGDYVQPHIGVLEAALDYGIQQGRGRVLVDLWDLERGVTACRDCLTGRKSRMQSMNLTQVLEPSVSCPVCGSEA